LSISHVAGDGASPLVLRIYLFIYYELVHEVQQVKK